jgi:aconitate hydratase
MNLTRKLIAEHLVEGRLEAGEPIALRIDQTLTQDATGTLVMLELEAMGLERVRTELSAQYVDHNLLQADFRNADDHVFLESACLRWGVWFSRPGNGVSHVVHMQRFGKPGKTLLGSDSHTCAAGSMGMLAIGAGGLQVAMAMAGHPYRLPMPEIWGVELTGELPDWVSAKDVILEMLRRHGVRGGVGRVLEYHGEGVDTLTAMDRHVIANMGAELGATSTVFSSDEATRRYLRAQGRESDWIELQADDRADYDQRETIDLSSLEPLIARPSSPGNVVPVTEVAGEPIYQAYIGSSANPGFRDFAVPARMVRDHPVATGVSFDINPTSRQDLEHLIRDGSLADLIRSGARLHQAGCNGCIGMGQAPATGRNSLRTTPRNFPGRSGTREDSVFLCSPETATASAISGRIRDPREMEMDYPRVDLPSEGTERADQLVPPPSEEDAARVELVKGPNIESLSELSPVGEDVRLPVLLHLGDDVSTDGILPAGSRVLPFRSNIPAISKFAFVDLDPDYPVRAAATRDGEGHAIVAGHNYGQGSSREHAALATRYLGLRMVLAKSFARIHLQNLINFDVVPLVFADEADHERIARDESIEIDGLREMIRQGDAVTVRNVDRDVVIEARIPLSSSDRDVLLAGGLLAWAAHQ